jgi:hypothetical protein
VDKTMINIKYVRRKWPLIYRNENMTKYKKDKKINEEQMPGINGNEWAEEWKKCQNQFILLLLPLFLNLLAVHQALVVPAVPFADVLHGHDHIPPHLLLNVDVPPLPSSHLFVYTLPILEGVPVVVGGFELSVDIPSSFPRFFQSAPTICHFVHPPWSPLVPLPICSLVPSNLPHF